MGESTHTTPDPMRDDFQPSTFAFDGDSEAAIPSILAKYPAGRQASAVLPMLYLVQNQMKRQTGSAWVPVAGMDEVARLQLRSAHVMPFLQRELVNHVLDRRPG